MHADAEAPRTTASDARLVPDNRLTFSKVDAVFKSGNATRDTIPTHLIVGSDIPGDVADFYSHLCPAGVYERVGDTLMVNAPNCVDCKATDVVGPRWTPREGGGPKVPADVAQGVVRFLQRVRAVAEVSQDGKPQ